MQHCNVLSRFHRVAGQALLMAAVLVGPAWADTTDSYSMLALAYASPAAFAPATAVAPEEALSVHELNAPPIVATGIDLTLPTDDLWVRIRNGFAMPNLNDDLVLTHQQWYMSRPDALRRMVERARPYLHHIVEELEKRGMPTELALLPMVESSFNPMAYSRAHAAGLWQFIPSTGKRYNLEQNWWHDKRRDIVASTEAALDYLQAIYEMNGDWHLALASYNWGENAVRRAIEKNEAKGLPTDFSNLTMPAETRHYVPKLQALKNIFGNPRLAAELQIPALPNQAHFATVETDRPIDVKTAASLANMPLEEFLALNPAHNRPVIKAESTIAIPADRIGTFQANLENHSAPLCSWEAYTLKAGEKLEKVAPRFGISLADLKRVNGLQGRLKVYAGATVLVPAGPGTTNIAALPDEPALPQIVPDEPVRSHRLTKAEQRAERIAARSAKPSKGIAMSGHGRPRVVASGITAKHGGKGTAARLAARTGTVKAVAKAPRSPAKMAHTASGRRG